MIIYTLFDIRSVVSIAYSSHRRVRDMSKNNNYDHDHHKPYSYFVGSPT